nr:reverse transcriptase domain-containing protein [Tanacetum cinerariifolium]
MAAGTTKAPSDHRRHQSWMNFMIVRSLSPYNGIIGRPGIRAIQAVPSTVHRMLKFPIERGIVTIRSTILIPTECTSVITSSTVSREERTRPANFRVALHPDFPDQEVAIGGTLSDKGRTELCSILKKNLDIFAWQPSNMIGVPRGQAPERVKAIQADVQKLVEAWIMREVYYHNWLSNLVMLRKHDGSWRMCVDFTNLNKACPQDCYPLSEIDWKVESLCGYPFKCLLDAYKGYHQIQLAEPDEEKTSFHTRQGVYCYTKMPFGLKNAGATYQRLMDKAFESQIGRNIKVKNVLGICNHPEGIKPCPNKTAAVLQLPSARTIKEVQSLNGKLSSLNRFLSKSAEKSLPLFQTLKRCIKKSDFHWTAEEEQAFNQLKQHLSELPLLVAPKPKEELIIYLFATYRAISASLMTERGTQRDFGGIFKHILSRSLPINPSSMSCLVPTWQDGYKNRVSCWESIILRTCQERRSKDRTWHTFSSRCRAKTHKPRQRQKLSRSRGRFSRTVRHFATSNNKSEYEALIADQWIATRMGVKDVHVSVDSKLVANQVLGTYVAKEDNMVKYLEIVKSLVIGFTTFSISQVPRSKNKKADALSKIASTSFAHLSKQESLCTPNVLAYDIKDAESVAARVATRLCGRPCIRIVGLCLFENGRQTIRK